MVFVTAYDQYAVEAFEVAALDYLLKPIRRERLAEASAVWPPSRVAPVPRHDVRRPSRARSISRASRTACRRSSGCRCGIVAKCGCWISTQVPLVFSRDRLVLARAEGREYLVDYTLQELEHRLPEGEFVRVHRGALVNVRAIESFGGENGVLVLRLKDGSRIEASERRAAEVRRKLR